MRELANACTLLPFGSGSREIFRSLCLSALVREERQKRSKDAIFSIRAHHPKVGGSHAEISKRLHERGERFVIKAPYRLTAGALGFDTLCAVSAPKTGRLESRSTPICLSTDA